MGDWMWLFATAGGALILGIAILYGRSRSKSHHPSATTQQKSDERTRELYENADENR